MTSIELIRCLSDGEFHSGSDLGVVLGVSRAAVWKQVQKLEGFGLKVESAKGRGYRIAGGLDLLDYELIRSFIMPTQLVSITQFDVLQSVDSTNSYAMALPTEKEPSRGAANVCMAEQQTAGRGRRGRTWVSPYGKNIYLSCTWGFEGGAAVLEGLSLAVGVALVRALEVCGLDGVNLKWPNDLLWCGRKVAGVLLEMTGDASGYCRVVVGVGLNVSMAAQESDGVTQPWVSLSEIAESGGVLLPSRNRISAEILNELLPLLADYSESGFTAWRDEWSRLDAFRGRDVRVISGLREEVGVAAGVDDTGAFLLQVEGELKKCSGGELSLRLIECEQ